MTTLNERLARMEEKLDGIDKKVDHLSDHNVRIDRLEQSHKKASKFFWITFTAAIGLALESMWHRFSGR